MVGIIGAMEEEVWDSRAVSGAAGIVADRGYDRMRDAGESIHEVL